MSKSFETPDDAQRPPPEEGQNEELAQAPAPDSLDEQVFDLPSREALSIVDPGVFGVGIPIPLGRTADAAPAAPGSAEPTLAS